MMTLAAGDTAPEFRLSDQDGKEVALADFAGRRVVVYFYPKDDTPGCTLEAQQFQGLAQGFGDAGVEVVGISPDDAASHRRFRERYGLGIRLLSDPGYEVMERYGAYGEKTMYGRTSKGVIRSTFLVGPDGKVEQAWYRVRADGHPAKVLAALEG